MTYFQYRHTSISICILPIFQIDDVWHENITEHMLFNRTHTRLTKSQQMVINYKNAQN